jgi:hypothetical protein
MTTLKVNKPSIVRTPSEEIIEDAGRIVQLTTPKGRSIGIRRVDMSIRRRIFKTLSADSQEKEQYLGMVMLAASVCEIDGEEHRLPKTELQFDALIDRLDDDGLNEISKGYREHFRSNAKVADEAGE